MKNILTIVLFAFLLSNCADNKTKIINQIADLEQKIKQEDFPSQENMDAIIDLYSEYADTYPDDSKTYGYLELKAKYQLASENYTAAVNTYKYLIKEFTDNEHTPENIFMLAFIYDTHLGDKKGAEILYNQIIATYPEHDLVDDAQFSLENLYLSEGDIIRMLEEKNKNVYNEENLE